MSDESTTTATSHPDQGNAGGRVDRRQYQPATTVEDFSHNLSVVNQRIQAAALRAGRTPADIRLLAVSKTVPQDRLANAVAAGLTDLAENKVQEAQSKAEAFAEAGLPVRMTMIGHLQTNKAKNVAEFAHEFHALDSLKLAEALDRRLQNVGRAIDVLVQVNVSDEDTKFGLQAHEVPQFLAALPQFECLNVKGFMTLARNTTNESQVRQCFRDLKAVRDRARQDSPQGSNLSELSMGMSGDFEVAIEEGSTVVRVGQALFGSRALPYLNQIS